MPVSDVFEKLGHLIFEAPFHISDEELPELAEIRIAVLDAVLDKTHRVAGRGVFPYNVVRISVLGVAGEGAKYAKGPFLARYFEQEIGEALSKRRTRFPADLEVQLETSAALPAKGEPWLSVETFSVERPAAAPVAKRTAKLTVVKGAANARDFTVAKARLNIGRTVDVYRAGGLARRNEIVFNEDNEVNRTVSREHAHVTWSKTSGEYRLYNDRWYNDGASCGLWIVRDGMTHEVHRTERGVRLQPGDEVHLGKAVLKFIVK